MRVPRDMTWHRVFSFSGVVSRAKFRALVAISLHVLLVFSASGALHADEPRAVVAATFVIVALSDQFVAAQESRSPAVRFALGKILTEDHVAHSAYSVCTHAMSLPDADKFLLLAAYVLPSADHDTLRLSFDMTPTCPAPVPETTAAALPMAILGTCTLLVTTLGLYVALCVAIFAVF